MPHSSIIDAELLKTLNFISILLRSIASSMPPFSSPMLIPAVVTSNGVGFLTAEVHEMRLSTGLIGLGLALGFSTSVAA